MSLFLIPSRSFSTPLPLLVLRVGNVPRVPNNSVVWLTWTQLRSNKGLGSTSKWLYVFQWNIYIYIYVIWVIVLQVVDDLLFKLCVATPLWPSVGWSPTLGKVGDLESSGTLECSELDNKAQNTLNWGVRSVIGKVLKRRYRKWPHIGNSDICSPSYGQKKGRESNWQFDSRPLKVRNRPFPDIRFKCPTWRWKDLDEGYNFGTNLVAIGLYSRELWPFKVLGVLSGQFRDSISGIPGICAIWM